MYLSLQIDGVAGENKSSLQIGIRKTVGEPKSDLRRRKSDSNAVPADATFAHLVRVMRLTVIGGEGIRGLTRNVPGQGSHKNQRHNGGGNDQHKATAEASPTHKPVGLNTGDHSHIDRRKVAHHRITDGHNRTKQRVEGN